eukprot:TRINITY_DN33980_c0_g1_i1.p1 TRINITY_DN33980_c0_g1~~TRINITY_DN33980_c0_g1_i1.p1  ORF type:complete len:172 (+),score=5.60 TRINITY_DN33980_c0_g1_i1:137-652(+)
MACSDMDCPGGFGSVACIITYHHCYVAELLNYGLIAISAPSFICCHPPEMRMYSVLAFAFFFSFQIVLCVAVGCSGVSVVWSAMLGYSGGAIIYIFKSWATQHVKVKILFAPSVVLDLSAITYYACIMDSLTTLAHVCAFLMGVLTVSLYKLFGIAQNDMRGDGLLLQGLP